MLAELFQIMLLWTKHPEQQFISHGRWTLMHQLGNNVALL